MTQVPRFKKDHCVRLERPHTNSGMMGIPKIYLQEWGRIVQVVDNLHFDTEPMYAVQFFSFPFAFQVRESMLELENHTLLDIR